MFRFLFLLLLINCISGAQTFTRSDAERFIHDLIWNPDSSQSWFDQSSLLLARRLGIEYQGVTCKNLISSDLEDSIKQAIREKREGYAIKLVTPDQVYTHLVLRIGRNAVTRDFYFKNRQAISPLAYLCRDWHAFESRHFRFMISDTLLFNPYCVWQLEQFVSDLSILLGYNQQQQQILQENKIYYYLCRDEDEIERITGFRSRGLYNLAYDAVITTFNTHYHELAHLLINFKLQRLALYTHPFLQEGFAVAFGGRGGLDRRVVLPMGYFLIRSQFAELAALLRRQEFLQLDASLSYPIAGLYTRFLIESTGIESYLDLYRKHTAEINNAAVWQIQTAELPADSLFSSYLADRSGNNPIRLEQPSAQSRIIVSCDSVNVSEDNQKYYFLLKDHLLLKSNLNLPHYNSKIFREIFPPSLYHGEKYLIRANADEISIYNLFTNELVAGYVAAFTLPPASVPVKTGRFCFSIDKNIFSEPLLF